MISRAPKSDSRKAIPIIERRIVILIITPSVIKRYLMASGRLGHATCSNSLTEFVKGENNEELSFFCDIGIFAIEYRKTYKEVKKENQPT